MNTYNSELKKFYSIQSKIESCVRKGENRDRTRRRRNDLIQEYLHYYLNKTNKYIYWFTFTFNDEKLSLGKKTLRYSFTKYLKRNKLGYLLFSDYGNENERFHLHGFVVSELELVGDVYNKYGHTKYRQVFSEYGYEVLTAQFYLSQKNFNEFIDRLWKHNV